MILFGKEYLGRDNNLAKVIHQIRANANLLNLNLTIIILRILSFTIKKQLFIRISL